MSDKKFRNKLKKTMDQIVSEKAGELMQAVFEKVNTMPFRKRFVFAMKILFKKM